MVEPGLSRRAANAVQGVDIATRMSFIKALERAKTFDKLPKKWQRFITDAEERGSK